MRQFIPSSHRAERSELDEKLHLCVESDPTLRTHLRARIAQLEELIAPAIARDLGVRDDDVSPQVVAASLTAAFNALLEGGDGIKGKAYSTKDVAASIDPVIKFLRGGLDALKEQRTTRHG